MKPAYELLAGVFIAWSVMHAAGGDGNAAPETDQPATPTALTEKVEKRLVQLDVAVEGDRDAIRGITAKDLALYVGEHAVQGLIVDHLCAEEPPPTPLPEQGNAAEVPAPVAAPQATRPRATFVFFFDQTHLTLAGREFALITARELINRLVVEGSRASIVSSARRLETFVAMTGDRGTLLAGLEKLRNDPRHIDPYAQSERNRKETPFATCAMMKAFARDEWMEARRSTERIGFSVGALAEVQAPKGLIYFGDNLRQKAGLHYLYGVCRQRRDPRSLVDNPLRDGFGFDEVSGAEMVPSAAHEFLAVVTEAVARGVHFFTIQAEGITSDVGRRDKNWNNLRHHHAQDTLVLLAAETGGEAFLVGASNDYIGGRIEKLTSCRLLLSFPPGDLPRDKTMNVTLAVLVPNVNVQTQGRIVVPSPESLERARLLSAFTDPASSDDGSLRALLIPRGGDGKTWKAAVQVRLRPTGFPNNSAELGASVVRRDRVTEHFASSIATASGTRAMVLEKSLDIAPGEFSVVAVARDVKRGDVGSSRLDADWPNPVKSMAAIAPVAVLQQSRAAISTDGAVSSSGSLARDFDEMLDPSASVTLASVVCRGARTNAPIVVERWVEGGAPNEFTPMTIASTDDPCVQTIDVLNAGRLRPGIVDYHVVARVGEEIVAQERRTLRVAVSP